MTGDLPSNRRKAGNGQRVRTVEDHTGRSWILKEVAVAQEWRADVHAYRHWTSAIDGHAPMLAADEALRTLLLSEVRGGHPRTPGQRVHRQAGALLRRLHDAQPPRHQPSADLALGAARVERLVAQSREVLNAHEQAFLRTQADRVEGLPPGLQVPCHGDYRPHNWLLDGSRTLRCSSRPWWRRPGLASAFLEGYGRGLHAEEAEPIQGRMAVDALSHTAFGASREATNTSASDDRGPPT